ncbi:MAG: DUF2807 domain-containing protein [Bacteroidales bacterium]|jgi:hypothetical protein|nr:DUF2807 domain-containing protein [Bacteroidales bacterium]
MKTNKLIIMAVAVVGMVLTSCQKDIFYNEGHGNIISQTLELDDFTGINMLGAEDVEISYGEVQEIVVTGHANIIDRIKSNVFNSTWDIELERGSYRNYDLKYYITTPQINMIKNDGAAKVVVNDFVNQGDLSITIDGAGDIELNRMENTENLYITVDGVGHIKVLDEFPSLQLLDIYITGSGDFSGYPAVTNECFIEIDGAAKCEVSVVEHLDVIISGAGVVHYKGQPTINQDVSGLGTVSSKNN